MNRWKRVVCLILITNLLFALTACAPSLYSENEVLEILSEQYGEDFVIIETLNSNLYSITPSNFSVKSKLYSAAPSSNPENIFWVRQDVIKHGGLFVTYENAVEDTLTFDCFLKCLDNFLQENQINSFFTIGNNEEKELAEYLAEPHLQGGRIYVSITENTAEEIVTQIFNFTDAFYAEYPSKDRFHFTRLAICFYDDSKIARQELDESYLSLDKLYLSLPLYGLYDPYYEDETDIDSMMKEINEFYYGIKNE